MICQNKIQLFLQFGYNENIRKREVIIMKSPKYFINTESGEMSEGLSKKQMIDLLSDFWHYGNIRGNDYVYMSENSHVHINSGVNFYSAFYLSTPTKKDFHEEYGLSFAKALTSADYIEWGDSHDHHIWFKNGSKYSNIWKEISEREYKDCFHG